MYYFVIGADGNRYGPADIDTLVVWAGQGRIVASTLLIERGTDRQLRADELTAIVAALRRVSGRQGPVVVERGEPQAPESPTPIRAPSVSAGSSRVTRGSHDAVPPPPPPPPPAMHYAARGRIVGPKSKIVAGLLGIFFGGLGVHRFYLGYVGVGLFMLFLCVLATVTSMACAPGIGCGIIWIWGFVEGILCLCGGMRDADGLDLHD